MATQKSSTKVAVVGPNGNLGKYVIPALVSAGIEVTLVTRSPEITAALVQKLSKSKNFPQDAAISIEKGNYDTAESLAPSLVAHDSVISLLNRDQTAAQILVIDATIIAGVKHIIPAAFGMDTRVPEVRAIPHIAAGYVKSEEHLLKAIAATNGKTAYTLIHNGEFLEWAFDYDIMINLSSRGEKPSMICDGGDTKISASSMVDIGKAVATAVINRQDERYRNKFLLMHSITISQNDLLAIAKKILPDKPWPVIRVDTIELEKKSQEVFDASVASGEKAPASAYHGFFARVFFGKGKALFPEVDNGLLGVQERDTTWLTDLMERYLVD